MSRYYDLVCVEHDAPMGFHWNRGGDQLAALARHLEGWAQLAPLFEDPNWYTEIGFLYVEDAPRVETLVKFVQEHRGCTIKPRDEYGLWHDQCGQQINGEQCTRLIDGHEGPCAVKT